MGVLFNISYNSVGSTLDVLQNGSPTSDYSLFARCNNQPFDVWFVNLPQYCYDESNSDYEVRFSGGKSYSTILEAVFRKDHRCTGFYTDEELVTNRYRAQTLERLCRHSGVKFGTINVKLAATDTNILDSIASCGSFTGKGSGRYCLRELPDLPLSISLTRDVMNADIAFVSSENEKRQINPNSRGACVIVTSDELVFDEYFGGRFAFSCGSTHIIDFIHDWIFDFILPPVYKSAKETFANYSSTWNGIDPDTARIMTRMLTSGVPYIELRVNDKMWVGECKPITVIKFPETLPCRLALNCDNGVLSKTASGVSLRAEKQGVLNISLFPEKKPELKTQKTITLTQFVPVSKITMKLPQKLLTPGDSVNVIYMLSPAGAHNAGNIKWSVSDTKVAHVSNGHLTAVSAGKCTLRLAIDMLLCELPVVVYDKPRDVFFSTDCLSVKLGKTARLTASVYPANSAYDHIEYTILNSSVLDYDVKTQTVLPRREGRTIIKARIVDSAGVRAAEGRCEVTILPPKDIITPDIWFVSMLVSIIAVFAAYEFPVLQNLFAMAFSIIGLIQQIPVICRVSKRVNLFTAVRMLKYVLFTAFFWARQNLICGAIFAGLTLAASVADAIKSREIRAIIFLALSVIVILFAILTEFIFRRA